MVDTSKPAQWQLVETFGSIQENGVITLETFKLFLKTAKCDQDVEWNGDIREEDFVALCDVLGLTGADIRRYEREKRLKATVKRLRRLSALKR